MGNTKGNLYDKIKARRAKRLAEIEEIRRYNNRMRQRRWYKNKKIRMLQALERPKPVVPRHEIDEMEDFYVHVQAALHAAMPPGCRKYSIRSIAQQAISHVILNTPPPPDWMRQVHQTEHRREPGAEDERAPPRAFIAHMWPVAVEAARARYLELASRMR